jgi:hypothetical protein
VYGNSSANNVIPRGWRAQALAAFGREHKRESDPQALLYVRNSLQPLKRLTEELIARHPSLILG